MKDICQKLATKIERNLNSLVFLYGGSNLNFQLSFKDQANIIDKERNEMNILVYTSIYPAPEKIGIPADTKVVHYFAKEWTNCGHNVRVIYLHLNPIKKISESIKKFKLISTSHYEYEGIMVDLIECQLIKPHGRHPSRFQANIINKLVKSIKNGMDFNADKVFVHFPTAFTGITELVNSDAPTIATFHNADIITLKSEKKCLSYVSSFDVWGSRSRKISDYLCGISEKKIFQIYSGIDEKLLIGENGVYEKINKPNSVLTIVYAGNLIPLKNVDILIEAIKSIDSHNHIQLRIIGDGPEEDKLKRLSGDDDRIKFYGRLSREETINQMREADLFAMVSSPETFGLVYIEAMGQGCITLGSSGEGIDGVIVDGVNGYLIRPGDVKALRGV